MKIYAKCTISVRVEWWAPEKLYPVALEKSSSGDPVLTVWDNDNEPWDIEEVNTASFDFFQGGIQLDKEEVIRKLTPVEEEDPVYRPSHYAKWTIEPVEFLMRNRVEGWLFNVVKYTMRAGGKIYPGKDATESKIIDLEKAKRYIDMEINLLKGEDKL